MQVYGEDAGEGRAGECVALNLPELDHERVHRGTVLCGAAWMEAGGLFEAELRRLNALPATLKDGSEVQLHVGTASGQAVVAMLQNQRMTGGETQMVQMRLTEPLAVVPGERFVLRANVAIEGHSRLTTIGGGRILGTSNGRLRRRKPHVLERLKLRRAALDDRVEWAELMLREQVEPLAPVELQQRCFARPDEWEALLEQLRATDRVVPTPGGKFTHSARVEEVAQRIMVAVDACHAAHAELVGISEAELAMETGGHPEIFKLALGARVGSGVLKFNGAVYHRSGWRPRVSDPEHALSERAEAAFRQAGWAPPSTEALAAALCVPVERAEKLVRFLQDRGALVRLDDRVTMHRDAVERGKQAALELFRRAPSFTTMAFRDALGVSRKFAVPLLDHLDQVRFTARHGHDRSPGAEAKRLLSVGN